MKTTNQSGAASKAKRSRPKPSRARSNTAEILGEAAKAAPKKKPDPKWARHYQLLLQLRNRLLVQAGQLARAATEETPTYSMHMADAGTDSFDRDFALSMLSSDQDALYEVEEAIRRIENGTYGRCELTGKLIPKSRLAAIPWARFSAEAQRDLERAGALKQRRFGTFNALPPADSSDLEEHEDNPDAGETPAH